MRVLLLLSAVFLGACATMPKGEKVEPLPQASAIQSQIFIIYFDKEKKDNLVNIIHKYQDDIIYDYQNFNSLAVKITAHDLNERLAIYQKIDGVLQILEDQIMQLH